MPSWKTWRPELVVYISHYIRASLWLHAIEALKITSQNILGNTLYFSVRILMSCSFHKQILLKCELTSVINSLTVIIFFAAWPLFCLSTVNTSFKLNWGMTWNKPCVSTAHALMLTYSKQTTNRSIKLNFTGASRLPSIISLSCTLGYLHLLCFTHS